MMISVVGNLSNSHGQLKTILSLIDFSNFFGGKELGLDARLFELGMWYYYQAIRGSSKNMTFIVLRLSHLKWVLRD